MNFSVHLLKLGTVKQERSGEMNLTKLVSLHSLRSQRKGGCGDRQVQGVCLGQTAAAQCCPDGRPCGSLRAWKMLTCGERRGAGGLGMFLGRRVHAGPSLWGFFKEEHIGEVLGKDFNRISFSWCTKIRFVFLTSSVFGCGWQMALIGFLLSVALFILWLGRNASPLFLRVPDIGKIGFNRWLQAAQQVDFLPGYKLLFNPLSQFPFFARSGLLARFHFYLLEVMLPNSWIAMKQIRSSDLRSWILFFSIDKPRQNFKHRYRQQSIVNSMFPSPNIRN